MEAFGIFEGGGARGLAHVGAWKAAEERRVTFQGGIAGTSAGSILAALVAVGYTADELYDLDAISESKGKFDTDFLGFLDREMWDAFTRLKQSAEPFTHRGAFYSLLCTPRFYIRNWHILRKVWKDFGFFQTTTFATWIESLLKQKVPQRTGPNDSVAFQDCRIPLVIIATNATKREIMIYSMEKTPTQSVSQAVAASSSIPLFFQPQRTNAGTLVDGGLVSNFPAWVFDDRRRQAKVPTPTIGFKLVESQGKSRKTTLFAFLGDLFWSILTGDEQLETRRIEDLHIVPLRVSAGTFDFDMKPDDKDKLYREGRDDARSFFRDLIGPSNPEDMETVLRCIHSSMQAALERGNIHLRVNVMMPRSRNRLRVMYTCNMDDDTDDRLELPQDGGASGLCWRTHDFVLCDLLEAKKTFGPTWCMTKYQQALVRRSLRSLLSVPIFDHTRFDSSKSEVDNPLLGVLNFDSDEDLIKEFGRPKIQQTAATAAKLLSMSLRR